MKLTWYDSDEFPDGGANFHMSLSYHQRPFALFHQDLEQLGCDWAPPAAVRRRYWSLLPSRQYELLEARALLLRYLEVVENQLASIIREHSIAYWLHLYRRLAPGPIGADKQLHTIGLTRASLEAAIQKYAQVEMCSGVGFSNTVSIEKVLGGLLMESEFEIEREIVQSRAQLVLTDFSSAHLKEFYDAEHLAYEIWRTSAQLRAIGKGASLLVSDQPPYIEELRGPGLQRLISSYDSRLPSSGMGSITSTGMAFSDDLSDARRSDVIFLPVYNLGGLTSDNPWLAGLFENVFGLRLWPPVQFNFIWFPFMIRDYFTGHTPFASAFAEKQSTDLKSILAVISALCYRLFFAWRETRGRALLQYWQRAYEGPAKWKDVLKEINGFLPAAMDLLGLPRDQIDQLNISKAVQYLSLDGAKSIGIDLAYSGPHSIFLPCSDQRVFIDYAWIDRRLYDLFIGVSIPDQSFKGNALEEITRYETSTLPVSPCKALDGTYKQIDAAFAVNHRLVVVECKAVGKSIGFDRGNPEAIRFRKDIIDRALSQADDKASWLSEHPVGTNYDVSSFTGILPIAVTPFVEYIPSTSTWYWMTDSLPRVLTPKELRDALEDGILKSVDRNVVTL